MKCLLLFITLATTTPIIASMEDRVSDLETNNLLNPIRLGAELTVRYDKVDEDRCNDATTDIAFTCDSKTNHSFGINRLRFRLSMAANPTPKLFFYGRVAASKVTNVILPAEEGDDELLAVTLENNGRNFASGSGVYLERAYFNYSITDDLVFSAGRLPTIDGGPEHLTYGSAKLGTYPMLAYASILDGYGLTYSLGDITFRAIYHPWTNLYRSTDYGKYTNSRTTDGKAVMDKVEYYVGMIDYTKRRIGFARKLNIIAQYLTWKDALINNRTDPSYESDLLWGYDSFILYAELTNIAKLGLNLAMTYHQTTNHSKGSWTNLSQSAKDGLRALGQAKGDSEEAIQQQIQQAESLVPVFGVFTNEREKSTTGSASQVVVSYRLPVPALKRPTLGLEYFQSDDKYLYFSQSLDLISMHAVRGGSGMHLFWVQPIDDGLMIRLGYLAKDQIYRENVLFGEESRKYKDVSTTSPTELDRAENYYLEFNLTI